MSNAAKYRKRAAEFELQKQFDKAVTHYNRAIEAGDAEGEELDVAILNKLGDLSLRLGRVPEAVASYERAVEHYASVGLFNNSIALCSKILRHAPGRVGVYLTLGRVCARKGMRGDATRNFLEYASRMQQEGKTDEAMRSLAEVAGLMPELDEVRRLVEEHAARAGIALPAAATGESAAIMAPSANALVFLDVDYSSDRRLTPPRSVAPLRGNGTGQGAAAGAPSRGTPSSTTPASTSSLDGFLIFDPEEAEGSVEPIAVEGLEASAVPEVSASSAVESDSMLDADSSASEPSAPSPMIGVTDALGLQPERPEDAEDAEPLPGLLTDEAEALPEIVEETPTESVLEGLAAEELEVAAEAAEGSAQLAIEGEDAREGEEAPDAAPDAATELEAGREVAAPPDAAATADEAGDSAQAGEEAGVGPSEYENVLSDFGRFETPQAIEWLDIDAADIEYNSKSIQESEEESEQASQQESEAQPAAEADPSDENEDEDEVETESDEESPVPSARVDAKDEHSKADGFEPLPFLVFDDEIEEVDDVGIDLAAVDSLLDRTHGSDPTAETPSGLIVEDWKEQRAARDDENIVSPAPSELVVDPREETLPVATAAAAASPDVSPLPDLMPEERGPAEEVGATRGMLASFVRLNPHDFILPGELPPIIYPDALTFGTVAESAKSATYKVESAPSGEFTLENAVDVGDLDQITVTDDVREAAEISDELELVAPSDIEPTATLDAAQVDGLAVDELANEEDLYGDSLFADADDDVGLGALDELEEDRAHADARDLVLARCARLREEVAEHPGDWARRRRLGEALLEANERDAGLHELMETVVGLEREGALAEASRITDELVRIAPELVAHHQKRVELAVRLGEADRLRESYLDLADALVRGGNAVRAEPVYMRVLELDPWDDRARAALGEAAPPPPPPKPAAPKADDGYVNLSDWLADDGSSGDTRMRVKEPTATGDEDADFDRLLQHFRDGVARSIGEDDYDSHYDLGVAYKEMGLLDDAVAEFQRALRSPTHRLAAYEALGQCFLEQRSFPVAVTVLSRALHEPGLDDEQRVGVLYLLGYACEALQRRDEARSYFQRVYATDIQFRDVAARLAALEQVAR